MEIREYQDWSVHKILELADAFAELAKAFGNANEDNEGICEEEWKYRFLESREALGAQFSELGRLLMEAAGKFSEITDITKEAEEEIREALCSRTILLDRLLVLEHSDKRQEAYLTMHCKMGHCITSREVAERLSRRMRRRWRPAFDSRTVIGREPHTIKLEEEAGYRLLHGVARATKDSELCSGDTFTSIKLPMGRVLLCLADGMGSGKEAFLESATVLNLAEQLLETGFSAEGTIKMINAVLLLRGTEQKPTTMDLGLIDLYSGACEFVKLGAAVSFIKRKRYIEQIKAETLPMGMFRELEPVALEHNLEDGDKIIMVTDGVLEAFGELDKEGVLEELILSYRGENPREMANYILEQAIAASGVSRDDMTVLVAGIWEK